jgi:hypothetical protein
MGLMMRRRRPLMRIAAGAAAGAVAYQAGKRGGRGAPVSESAPPASNPTQDPAPGGQGPTAELERLTQLHASGALSDAEFAAAKSRVLNA